MPHLETIAQGSPASVPSARASSGRNPLWLPLVCVAIYLMIAAVLLALILHRNRGSFTYALDDAYIHMALAESIAHHHYGINPGEASSPSSSLLWPLLLAPFASQLWHRFVPLAWNLVFGVGSALLLGGALARWSAAAPAGSVLNSGPWRLKLVVTGALLLFVANLETLTFVGMEHTLQIFLSIACALGVTAALAHRRIPAWALVAAVLLPSVRYEGVGLTLAVALALWGARRRRASALTVALALVPLGIFALFLHAHGLPPLPTSVLVKSHTASHGTTSLLRYLSVFAGNLYLGFSSVEFWPLAILAVFFARFAWQTRDRAQRFALSGVALVAVLQSVVGRNGWFTRYEVYAVIFTVLVLVFLLTSRPATAMPFGFLCLGLVFCASPYILSTEAVPASAAQIYGQQLQMHRFTTEFYQGNFAVNDLGLVSYHRSPDSYVLDLWGLASPAASRQRVKDAAWLSGITAQHHADLAMIYPEWFDGIPGSWTPIGTLCLKAGAGAFGERCVVFYSTNPAATTLLRQDARRFAATLPSTDDFRLDSDQEQPVRSAPPG